MTTTAALPVEGAYDADAIHSSFGFAIRHMGVSTFRAGFADVRAELVERDGALELTGVATAESLTITQPDFRAHVLGADFLDADAHPELVFRSTRVDLHDDGRAAVAGVLAIRGIERDVVAEGTWTAPVEDPFGGVRAALELSTTVDRRDYGMTWSAPLPRGGDALATDVVLEIRLELVRRTA